MLSVDGEGKRKPNVQYSCRS